MADVVPAAAVEPGRADNALAYYITQLLRVAVVREMQQLQSHRSDLAPFALAAWCSFTIPSHLAWVRSMIDQCAQLVGATCLHEALGTRPSLTTDERSWAAEVRTSITEELQGMPTYYLESKIEQISPGLRTVAERYLNATSELFFVMYNTVQDPIWLEVAERTAETCVRCHFRRPPGSLWCHRHPFPRARHIVRGLPGSPHLTWSTHVMLELDADPSRRHDLQFDDTDSSGDGIVADHPSSGWWWHSTIFSSAWHQDWCGPGSGRYRWRSPDKTHHWSSFQWMDPWRVNHHRGEQPIAKAILLHMWHGTNICPPTILPWHHRLRQHQHHRRVPLPWNRRPQNCCPLEECGRGCFVPTTLFNWVVRTVKFLLCRCLEQRRQLPACTGKRIPVHCTRPFG